jgi:tRNA-2-methylthio-N6-dimethylallyladenosine synthase
LSSDFIVGFPGETDDDFEQTMDLIEQARFDSAFSFLYSPRPGTPAANLRDNVPQDVKQARLERLQARIRAFGAEFAQKLVGSDQRVLIEKPARKGDGMLAGKTECNRWVNFPLPAGVAPEALLGRFATVRITEALPNSLRGRLVAFEPNSSQSAA